MIKHGKILAIASLSLALGGCSSFWHTMGFKSDGQRGQPERLASVGTPVSQFEIALQEGRQMVADGNLASAASAFRLAMRDASTMAEATNGLGIVYAKMKRYDLAERYFRLAATLAPQDTKYAANLARLQRDVMMARGAVPVDAVRVALPEATPLAPQEKVPAVVADAMAAPVQPVGAVRIELPAAKPAKATQAKAKPAQGRLEQVATREFHIQTTAAPEAAPAMTVATRSEPKAAPAPAAKEPASVEPAAAEEKSHTLVIDFPG